MGSYRGNLSQASESGQSQAPLHQGTHSSDKMISQLDHQIEVLARASRWAYQPTSFEVKQVLAC